jgi:hypothetical protein
MPTPFTHLYTIQTLLTDPAVPPPYRAALQAERGAFLLGSVVPDARVDAPDPRAATHFYNYHDGIQHEPWQRMLEQNPTLHTPSSAAHRAFIAGYIAHIAMDTVWSRDMMLPHFANGDWGKDIKWRFFVLHLILIDMDERDLNRLPSDIAAVMRPTLPERWLPFMPDDVIVGWRDMIDAQIRPDGETKTFEIFGERVGKTPEALRATWEDSAFMAQEVWAHIPHELVSAQEDAMLRHARASLIDYLGATD